MPGPVRRSKKIFRETQLFSADLAQGNDSTGLRVEMTGFGVTQGADEEDPGYRLPTDAPVIHVRGVAYKGTVEITTRPPERPALRR